MNQYERNLSLLEEYFQNGCKQNCFSQLGLEVEHFIVKKDTKESVSYYGEYGVRDILERLKPSYLHTYYEGENLLGLYNSDYSLSLEPAAQLEISINPREEISEIRNIYRNFVRQITPILEGFGYELSMLGYQPKSCVQDLKLIPKKRYDYMDAYFKTSGTTGANMMRGTASAQISVDFFSERDFVRKMRAAYILMPAIRLLTDCTPVFEGKSYEKHMARTMIWRNVDPKRCGVVPGLFEEDFGFQKYAEYLMDLPLIFIPNNGNPIPTGEQTASELWADRDFTESEMEHVLSMTFVDVRLKHYLEIRGADCMPFVDVLGYLALVKGIFFHEEALSEILNTSVTEAMIREAEDSLMEDGFAGRIYGMDAPEYLRKIIRLAKEHLGGNEQAYLVPLENIVEEKGAWRDSMKSEKMQQIAKEYEQYIIEHAGACEASGAAIKDYLDHSTAAYDGLVVHTLHIPKIFTEKEIEYFRWIVKTTYGILEKVIREYLDNPSYRKYFPFSKELEELILVPNLYDSLLPITRFDIFFNEEDWSFKFCEINTDGTSAMNEDYVLNQALSLNDAHQEMLKKYKFSTFELYDSWVESMMNLYATYEKKVEHPYVVITDFMDHCCVNEFKEFAARFKKAGYEVEICNIRDMTYRDGVLYSAAGHPIDVIYRRAVTCDIMAHYKEIQPFIQAVKDQNVCVIGSICTQIPHNKWLFKMLREKATMELLSEEEQKFVTEHIPYTNLMDSRFCRKNDILDEKDRWIIKPLDSYASRGVFAGIDYSDDEWEDIVNQNWNKNYIYQEYYHPYRTENICFRDAKPEFHPYTNMTGLYVYNGAFAGIYSRLSTGGIISSQYNERAVATLVLKEEEA